MRLGAIHCTKVTKKNWILQIQFFQLCIVRRYAVLKRPKIVLILLKKEGALIIFVQYTLP